MPIYRQVPKPVPQPQEPLFRPRPPLKAVRQNSIPHAQGYQRSHVTPPLVNLFAPSKETAGYKQPEVEVQVHTALITQRPWPAKKIYMASKKSEKDRKHTKPEQKSYNNTCPSTCSPKESSAESESATRKKRVQFQCQQTVRHKST